MNKLAISLVMAVLALPAFADEQTVVSNVSVVRNDLGTGVPGQQGVENAFKMPEGTYHVPQYLPGTPTAATIYPRVVEVNCNRTVDGSLTCNGYNWTPDMGRAEYLLIKPRVVQPVQPVVVEKTVTVLKEVPCKKKGE